MSGGIRAARAEAVFRVMEDELPRTTQQITAACGFINGGVTKKAIKDAAVIAKAYGKCLVPACPENGNMHRVTSVAAQPTVAPSHFLHQVEKGVRERRRELDEFAMRHTGDLSVPERRLLRMKVQSDRAQEAAGAAADAYITELENQLRAERRRSA
jgi:hypothetical protein